MLLVQEAQLTVRISEVFCFIYPNSDCFWISLPILFKGCGNNPEVENRGNRRASFHSDQLVARLSGFESFACMHTSSVMRILRLLVGLGQSYLLILLCLPKALHSRLLTQPHSTFLVCNCKLPLLRVHFYCI